MNSRWAYWIAGLGLAVFVFAWAAAFSVEAKPLSRVSFPGADVENDIAVVVLDSPDPVAEGQALTYRLVAQNNGGAKLPGVTLTDVISTTLVTFVSAAPAPQGTCTWTAPNLACDLGTVEGNGAVTVTVTTTANLLGDNLPKIAANTAVVASDKKDPNLTNNTATITTQINPDADLQIHLTSLVTTIQTGNPLTYVLLITNNGPSPASNIIVTDTLPVELTYKSSSRAPVSTSGQVVWNLGSLASNQSTSINLVVNVKSPTKLLVNRAAVGSAAMDSVPDNSQSETNVIAVDAVAPTAAWTLPVRLGGTAYVNDRTVRLEVLATDNVAVSYVRFYRWDALAQAYAEMGSDASVGVCQADGTQRCYHLDFNTSVLNPKWNEARASAYDESGNASPSPELNTSIWLYYLPGRIFMPFIKR